VPTCPRCRKDLHCSEFGFTNSQIRAAQVGSAVGKHLHKPKIDFYDPFSFYIYNLYGFLLSEHKYMETIPESAYDGTLCNLVDGIALTQYNEMLAAYLCEWKVAPESVSECSKYLCE